MSRGRAVALGFLITLAVLVQVTVLSRLELPGGRPMLLVLVIAGVAVSHGPAVGMVAGFAGGVLADLAPPSGLPLGSTVLVLVLVAELVGLLTRRPSGMVRPVALVALATALSGFGMAGLGVVLGSPLPDAGAVLGGVAAATAYNVALAPGLLLLIGGSRAVAPARSRTAASALARGRGREPLGGSATAGGLR